MMIQRTMQSSSLSYPSKNFGIYSFIIFTISYYLYLLFFTLIIVIDDNIIYFLVFFKEIVTCFAHLVERLCGGKIDSIIRTVLNNNIF